MTREEMEAKSNTSGAVVPYEMKQKAGPLQTYNTRHPGGDAPNSANAGPEARRHYSQSYSQASTSVYAFAPTINITITNGNFIYNSNHFGCCKATRQSTPLSRHNASGHITVGTNSTRNPTPKGQSASCKPSRQRHRKQSRNH